MPPFSPRQYRQVKYALVYIYVLSVISVQFCRFPLMLFLPLDLTAAFRLLWCAHCGQFSLPQFMASHRLGGISCQPGHPIGIIHR